MPAKKRIIHKKDGTDWVQVDMKTLSNGDQIKMFEPDGVTPIKIGRVAIFTVVEEPIQIEVEGFKNKRWAVKIDTNKKKDKS